MALKYRTERLLIREANMDDSTFIYDLLNSPTWIAHIGDRNIRSLADAEVYIKESLIKSYRENDFGLYVVELADSNSPIGLCGLLKREQLDHVDIGFAILPQYARQGYTYEAASKIMMESGFSIVLGITYEGNVASQAILRKLGLKHIRNFHFGDYKEESMLFST